MPPRLARAPPRRALTDGLATPSLHGRGVMMSQSLPRYDTDRSQVGGASPGGPDQAGGGRRTAVGVEGAAGVARALEETGQLEPDLGGGRENVIGYWPKAAIGMVRNAGEQWLSTPDSPAKPGQEAMARQITAWLCVGIAPELSTSARG